jgi:hypothetical protein
MKKTMLLITTAIGIATLAAPVDAQTVKVNWRTKAPFGDYKTFTWKANEGQENTFYRQFVRQDVEEQMTKKGLTEASGASADLIAVYHFSTQEVADSTTTSDGFGMDGGPWGGGWSGVGGWGGWGMGGGGMMGGGISTTETEPRTMGILTVDLVDSKTKQVVWRGQATEDSLSNNQKGDEKQVQKSVEKMFAKFPPKSTS